MAWHDRIREFANTLTARFALGVVLIHALLIPALFGGLVLYASDIFRSSFVNQVRVDAQMLAWLASKDMSPAELDNFLFESALSGNLVFARVIVPDGRVLAELSSTETYPEFKEDFFFSQNDDSTYFIAVPIRGANHESLGTLQLGYDETPTEEAISLLYQRGTWLAAAYALLSLLLAAFWGHRLSQPLRRLRHLSRQVALGKFREPLTVRSSLVEISSLAHDLNLMRHELVKKTESMEHLALHDTLTGLPNRTLLEDRFQHAVSMATRERKSIGLAVIDLDNFKEINDTLGHSAGDQVLKLAAERLKRLLRASDTIARLGGDEFALILMDATAPDIRGLLVKLCHTMHQPFQLGEQPFNVGLSLGISIYPEHGNNFDALLQCADTAMYLAKKQRKDYVFYDSSQEMQDSDKLVLATELRRGIRNHDVLPYYQPIVELTSGETVGYEALARWRHPTRGLLSPDVFIPLADKIGLIEELTFDMLARAFHEYPQLPSNGRPLSIAVNLSARSLHNDDLPRILSSLLERHSIAPWCLTLEVTENEVMLDPAGSVQMLKRLRELGVRIALDDFGTGYSSLEYLRNLPVDAVKIDKSFVWRMVEEKRDADIVRALIALSHTLGIMVYAEGVQDADTLEALQRADCDYVQGFWISEPLPVHMLKLTALV